MFLSNAYLDPRKVLILQMINNRLQTIVGAGASLFLNPYISKVDINIIYGNIDSLKDIPFGTLVIEISGSAAGIKNALQYLHEQQLKVEVIGYVS